MFGLAPALGALGSGCGAMPSRWPTWITGKKDLYGKTSVRVGVGVGVGTGVLVGVGVRVSVGVTVLVGVGVSVRVDVGVLVGVKVCVGVGDLVEVGVSEGVGVRDSVTVEVGARVGVGVMLTLRSSRNDPDCQMPVGMAAWPATLNTTTSPRTPPSFVGVSGSSPGTSMAYQPPLRDAVRAYCTPPIQAVTSVPSGAGTPLIVTVPQAL